MKNTVLQELISNQGILATVVLALTTLLTVTSCGKPSGGAASGASAPTKDFIDEHGYFEYHVSPTLCLQGSKHLSVRILDTTTGEMAVPRGQDFTSFIEESNGRGFSTPGIVTIGVCHPFYYGECVLTDIDAGKVSFYFAINVSTSEYLSDRDMRAVQHFMGEQCESTWSPRMPLDFVRAFVR